VAELAVQLGAPVKGMGRTLVFGFATAFTVALVNVLATPFLLRLLGEEAYGLVAFFTVLQAWVLLFDFGVSPALARQLSRHRAGALGGTDTARLFAAAEIVFLVAGLIAGAALLLGAPWVGDHWLRRAGLSAAELDNSLRLIAGLLVCRWLCGLYEAALVGLERQNLANGVIAGSVVLRYAAAILVLQYLSPRPTTFFAVQAAFTLAEAVVARLLLARFLPARPRGAPPGWRLLAAERRFALGLTLAAAAATLISQIDKLALSHAMTLPAYGLFGLVAQVTAGVGLAVPPFVQVFQPRLTGLLAQDRRAEFIHVYRVAVALILSLAAALAGTIAAQPVWVIWAWTGRADAAANLAPILTLYAAGAAIAAFLFAPFLLQYAQGRVRLHVIGNVGFALVWAPAAVWAAFALGPIGTGAVWLVGNLLYLFAWTPLIHARMLAPEERRGLDLSIWLRGAALTGLLAATRLLPIGSLTRLEALIALGVMSLVIGLIGISLSADARDFVRHGFGRAPS
jgi:O-antigen/teichoic acid export membrane protein